MKKLRLAVAVAVVAAFSVLASSPAQAYPGVTVTVSEATVVGGNPIEITATVDPDIDCDWELTFLGDTVTGSGTSITETFDTPEVDDVEQHEAVAECFFDNGLEARGGGGSRTLGASLATVEVSSTGSGTQTLLPVDDDDDGDGDEDGDEDGDGDGDGGGILPNTGGERLAWLVIGAMLVLVGGGVVMASRRRDA
jgi:LPXTG-motif cell wall-anchored protein